MTVDEVIYAYFAALAFRKSSVDAWKTGNNVVAVVAVVQSAASKCTFTTVAKQRDVAVPHAASKP